LARLARRERDRNAPFAHGQRLAAHLPNARPHLLAGEGHLSLGVDSFGANFDDLLVIAPLEAS